MKDGKNPRVRVLSVADFKSRMFDPEPHFEESERQLAKLDIGWAKAALGLRTLGAHRHGHENNLKTRSLLRVFVQLEECRKRFESGNTNALLQGVGVCADENVPLPTWLAKAFQDALERFGSVGGQNSLDAVFFSPSLPRTENRLNQKRLDAARQDWAKGAELLVAAWDAARSDEKLQSLDAVITAVLSTGKYSAGKTKAREIILMVEKNQLEWLGHRQSQSLSHFLDKRRKR